MIPIPVFNWLMLMHRCTDVSIEMVAAGVDILGGRRPENDPPALARRPRSRVLQFDELCCWRALRVLTNSMRIEQQRGELWRSERDDIGVIPLGKPNDVWNLRMPGSLVMSADILFELNDKVSRDWRRRDRSVTG